MNRDVPAAAEPLLAVRPDEFIAERQRLARKLRDAGHSAEAATVAQLRKPPPVVLAVNRAARSRPKAARAAAAAADRVKQAQLGGNLEAFRGALTELEKSLELLAEVALAHVSPSGKRPSEAVRRRLHDLLRNAVADSEAREALARGILTSELETTGFAAFAGMVPGSPRPGRSTASGRSTRRPHDDKRRERERALRAELAAAEKHLRESERSLQSAERVREKAERMVASIRTKLEQL
jgi:hypothetical protein